MSAARHYPKAPITEAVIDLRVMPSSTLVLSDLAIVREADETEHPTVEQVNTVMGRMQVGHEVSASASSQHVGFLFRSADGKRIHQALTSGFSMSQLAPYPRWEDFCTEARRRWNTYRAVAQPDKVVRVAVRYINRIDIPLPLYDFGEYLRTVPQVSPDLPQGLSSYFMQLTMPLESIKSQVVINETIIDPARPDVVSIVLDIDISRDNDLPVTEEETWAFIEQLRHAKNNVFEMCITDKARELFR